MKKEYKIVLSVGIGVFLLYLAIHFWPAVYQFLLTLLGAAFPLFAGAVLAYIINLPMQFFERHFFPKSKKKWVEKIRRPASLGLSLFSMLAVLALVIGFMIPQLISCVKLILEQVPGAIRSAISFLDRYHLLSAEMLSLLSDVDWKSWVGDFISLLTNGFSGVVGVVIDTVSEVISWVVSAFLSLIFALYILLSKDRLKRQISLVFRHYFPRRFHQKTKYVLGVLDETFHRYTVSSVTEAIILGILCCMGMLILQIPYAAMVSALIAVTALIPIAGAYIGAGVGAFMILTVSPLKALIFLVFLVVLQQIEGNFIYPKVVGSSLRLPGIWVLAAVTLGGGLAGILGMLLGVPLVAALYRILSDDLENRERIALQKQQAEAAPDEE